VYPLTSISKTLFISVFVFLNFFTINAQTGIKGSVCDHKGKPLPYSTIYIKELKTGTVANINGYFEYSMPPGEYQIDFRCLGYQTVSKQISVIKGYTFLNIQLKEQFIELKTVSIYSTNENPAYPIMRKAIAASHYYRMLVKAYDADIYIKGASEIRLPRIILKLDKSEGFDTVEYGTNESFNHIHFEYPAKYEQNVISARNNSNDSTIDMVNHYTNASIYAPDFGGTVSPLSPSAFSFYRFKLISTFNENGAEIYKISVIPRSKGSTFFRGDIYIVNKLWCVYNFNLKTQWEGFEIAINQMFAPVSNKIWVPINQQYDINGSLLGIKIKWKYLASLSNYKLELNDSLEFVKFTLIDEKTEREYAKALEEERRLKKVKPEAQTDSSIGKQKESEFTLSDFKRLMKDYEKEEKKKVKEPELISDYSTVIDSMAFKKNNQYWDSIRPIPLTELEKQPSHEVKKDSILTKKNKKDKDSSSLFLNTLSDIFFGYTFKINKNWKLDYISPLLGVNFNSVEGLNLKIPFKLEYQIKDRTNFKFEPGFRYGFSNETFSSFFIFSYDNIKNKYRKVSVKLQGGRRIIQFNANEPILPFFNSLTTLIWRNNYMKIYQNDLAEVELRKLLTDKLTIKAGVGWSERTPLENQTNYSWAKTTDSSYLPNAPLNIEDSMTAFPVHQAFTAGLKFEYRPIVKYRKVNGVKQPLSNLFPVLSLEYKGGFKGILGSDVDFHRLEGSFQHQITGYRANLNFKLFGGNTFVKNQLYFMDYKHFNGSKIPIDYIDPMNSYQLLDYYYYSTKGAYFGLYANLSIKKFLLTQLSWLSLMGIREGITFNYLKTEYSPHYYEIGYAIENIGKLFKLEVFTSFENGLYKEYGIKIGISMMGLISFDDGEE
jgi:hypothetical protein